MMRHLPLLLAGLGLGLAVPTAAQAPKAAAARDWTRTIVNTAEGGVRMGNPAARVKLIEYGAFSCSHCAHFAAESKTGIAAAVRGGKTSFEFRPYLLGPLDIPASLLSRCMTPARSLAFNAALFRNQSQWTGRVAAARAQANAAMGLPANQKFVKLGAIAGLTQLAATHGLTPARANACLADTAAADRLVVITENAQRQYGVRGTPTFILNGNTLGSYDWGMLAAAIRQAGG